MKHAERRGALALVTSVFALANVAHAQPLSVKIGTLSDMSSIYADIGGAGTLVAARMAAEDFAKRPGGDRIKVEIVQADSLNKADVGSTITRRWIDTENVDMVLEVPTSAVALAVLPVVADRNKVTMISGAGASDITGKACTPNSVHWTWDTWSLSRGTAAAVTKAGGKSWFFMTADYAFGHALERDASAVVLENGGKVLGAVRHPIENKDYGSHLLQAQGSGAQIIGLANAGSDTINSIKQSAEFGIGRDGKQKLAGMVLFLSDIHSLGLKTAQGLNLTTAYYWDLDEKTRSFGERFAARNGGRYPTMVHAGAYSSVLAYLSAVQKLGSAKDGRAIVAAMRDGTIDDPLFGPTTVRLDGRAVHRMLLVEVKKPEESKKPYDYYKLVSTIPPEEAFRPLKDGGCPLAK